MLYKCSCIISQKHRHNSFYNILCCTLCSQFPNGAFGLLHNTSSILLSKMWWYVSIVPTHRKCLCHRRQLSYTSHPPHFFSHSTNTGTGLKNDLCFSKNFTCFCKRCPTHLCEVSHINCILDKFWLVILGEMCHFSLVPVTTDTLHTFLSSEFGIFVSHSLSTQNDGNWILQF